MENVEYTNDENLAITSDLDIFDITFYKDKTYLMNLDSYIKFIKGCEKMVRHHPDYENFISSIREIHMEHCQVLGNITRFEGTIEGHHGPLFTLWDYCAIVTDHLTALGETVNSFKIAKIVLDEHYKEHVQIVMLCKTAHQMVNSGELFINLSQGIGNVQAFMDTYKLGLERHIDKINEYIRMSKEFKSQDSGIFDLEEKIVNWEYKNLPNAFERRLE